MKRLFCPLCFVTKVWVLKKLMYRVTIGDEVKHKHLVSNKFIERFSNENEKPKPKQLCRPITTGANSAMNQSQFLEITSNSLETRGKSRVHGAIGFGFGFASHWLKNWRESFKPITKRSNRNHIITFDSHLKTALSVKFTT